MPFINIKTNAAVTPEKAQAVKAALGEAIRTIPGKSEQSLMVGIEPDYTLYFQGTDAPAAMVQVSIYGSASSTAYDTLTGKICDILTDTLGIPALRTYVAYQETPNWGWNGGNF